MADKTISQLTGATTPLAGTEVLPIVQSSSTKKVAVSDLTAGRAISSLNVAVTGSTVPANGFYLPAANTVAIATNSGEKLRVDSSGNVGVGTTTPTTIANTATVSINSTASNTTGIVVHQNNGNQVARSGVLSGYYLFQDLASANGMLFDEQGALPIRFNTNGTTKLTVQSSGNTHVETGNLVIGTAGKGIDFSANTGAPGMTSELLTRYEEGAYTATMTPTTSGTITLAGTHNTLTYTRVGRMVTVVGMLMVDSVGSPVGAININLPIAAAAGNSFNSAVALFVNGSNGPLSADFIGQVSAGASTMTIYLGDGNYVQSDSANAMQATTQVSISATYFA